MSRPENSQALRQYFPPDLPEVKFTACVGYIHEAFGLVIFNKRPLQIPQVTEEAIVRAFGPDGVVKTESCFKKLYAFLQMLPVGDKFGSDHERRRTKINEVKRRIFKVNEQLAEAFKAMNNNNQLRVNWLGLMTFELQTMWLAAKQAGNHELAWFLRAIDVQLRRKLNGKNIDTGETEGLDYNSLDSLEEKLAIVQYFEDKIIEVLRLFQQEI